MKRQQNLLMLSLVVLLTIIPLVIVKSPALKADGKEAELFTGADDKATLIIKELSPEYRPWFSPIMQPSSSEVASLLFSLQAAIGAGFIGYFFGSRAKGANTHVNANE
ncbi:MAG: energy-coupling factor ABC transporter substrate-binding protein [Oligoflexia bacterium]|nr:energy-coupling factor ABC transporter substrate-binding protein [Oligoflexia bacterium]MBF0364036.1 energy-coupling factor ABC transporter substrate-binding protein [Oligoflexia bacterium]